MTRARDWWSDQFPRSMGVSVLVVLGLVVGWLAGSAGILTPQPDHEVLAFDVTSSCETSDWVNVTVDSRNPNTVNIVGQYFTNTTGQLGISRIDLQETRFNTLMVIVSTGSEDGPFVTNASECLSPVGEPPADLDWANRYTATLQTNAKEIRVYHDGRQATAVRIDE